MISMLLLIFCFGLLLITLEEPLKINKTATALIMGVLLWTIYILNSVSFTEVQLQLSELIGEISEILFFLLGAMTIVEVIDAHDGFQIITDHIKIKNQRNLLWVIALLTFFLSSILDNLTTTIIMVSLCKKMISERTQRLYFCSAVIIAANAGGAWSPLGDVTTTMLWAGGQISAFHIMQELFLPSIISLIIPLIYIHFKLSKDIKSNPLNENNSITTKVEQALILFFGLGILMMVPVFKTITHLPPYMSILLGLGLIWLITEMIHYKKDLTNKKHLSVATAIQKVDTPSILFFLGLLLAVGALQLTGILNIFTNWCAQHFSNITALAGFIGLVSALIDNVPIVATIQRMYPVTLYPMDHFFWNLITYSSGIGGSILIIGSAAGVASMGIERINFFWYLRKISLITLIGYLAGLFFYSFIQHAHS